MSAIDEEYIELCRDEMFAAADASQILVTEMLDDKAAGYPWTQHQIDLRRAELYKQHFDAAGIEIRRKA